MKTKKNIFYSLTALVTAGALSVAGAGVAPWLDWAQHSLGLRG